LALCVSPSSLFVVLAVWFVCKMVVPSLVPESYESVRIGVESGSDQALIYIVTGKNTIGR
ncbi:MAG: hypothetical protein JXK95_17205, partial [Bacteroidales bacterium]|nr:hypothetical protein [Bacteroidales bacterium]